MKQSAQTGAAAAEIALLRREFCKTEEANRTLARRDAAAIEQELRTGKSATDENP